MAFCTKCGNKMPEGANFCSNCGNKTGNSNIQNSYENNVASSPKPFMVLATNKKEGFLSMKICYLVFFDSKLILAHIDKKRQKQEALALQKQNKSQGKGFFKNALDMVNFWSIYGKKYYGMDMNSILNDDVNNFELHHSQINKFKFTASRRTNNADNTTKDQPGKIIIYTNNDKIKCTHKYKDPNKKIKNNLTNLYKNRLKYRSSGISTINIGKKNDDFC